MKQFGVKGKINLGFSVLFLLLMLSGALSIYELTRMRSSISGVLAKNVNNLVLSRQLLDVVGHISYGIQQLVIGNDDIARNELTLSDSLVVELERKVDIALDGQQPPDAVRSIAVLLSSLRNEVERAFNMNKEQRTYLYVNEFLPANRQLISQADELMQQNEKVLRENTMQVEQGRYRTIVPGIIAVFAGLVLILLFNYFMVYFFVNPLIKITRAVENTVEYGSPFKLNITSNDEIGELKEAITQLSLQAKKTAKAEVESQSVNGKKSVS